MTSNNILALSQRQLVAGSALRPGALAVAVAALAMAMALPAAAQTASVSAPAPALNPQAARITDKAIHADYATYERQQAAIKALNDSGNHRVASYSLAKAQCWLDVSFHEYSRNDRSAFPQEALTQSHRITQHLVQGAAARGTNPALETPLVNGAAKLRPDLWARAAQLKQHAGFRCAEQKVACAEVELVHAGNEQNQQQWRHAKPYVQIAEDLMGEADAAVLACVPPPAPYVAPTPLPPVAPPPPPPLPAAVVAPAPAPRPWLRQANVLFNFDKRDMGNVRALTKDSLDRVVDGIKSGRIDVKRIDLVGHADVSKNAKDQNYNTRLAEDRVQAVKAYLVAAGLDGARIGTSAKSDTEQVNACTQKGQSLAVYQECLLPNRRVEVQVEGFMPVR